MAVEDPEIVLLRTEEEGFYCSTSGTYFSDKKSLSDHYKSDFHRYNLKRKVAGLPPVTKDWFDARKAQLSTTSETIVQQVWFDPLTKKKFSSEKTYLAHVKSKKYKDLVRKSGQEAPAAVISVKKAGSPGKPQGHLANFQFYHNSFLCCYICCF